MNNPMLEGDEYQKKANIQGILYLAKLGLYETLMITTINTEGFFTVANDYCIFRTHEQETIFICLASYKYLDLEIAFFRQKLYDKKGRKYMRNMEHAKGWKIVV